MTDQPHVHDFKCFWKGRKVVVHATVHTKNKYYSPRTSDVIHAVTLRKVELPDPRSGFARRNHVARNFIKYPCTPWAGIIVGWSMRISCEYIPGSSSYDWGETDPGEMRQVQYHKVVMVIPTDQERWHPPYACLPEDLEPLA
jgi:hypothetical protein